MYTKYAWGIPLYNKGQTAANAFEKITNGLDRKPNKVWVDQGNEFYNRHFIIVPFEIYSTLTDGKAVVIEHFNHKLKQMMFKNFTEQGNQN